MTEKKLVLLTLRLLSNVRQKDASEEAAWPTGVIKTPASRFGDHRFKTRSDH